MDIKPYMGKFGFGHRESNHIVVEQNGKLWLAFASQGAGMFMMSGDSQGAGLLELDILHDGKPLPYTYSVTESIIEILSEKGSCRIVIDADARAVRFEGRGVTIRLDAGQAARGTTSFCTDGGVLLSIGGAQYFFASRQGKITFDDTWILNKFHSVTPVLEISPKDGKVELVAYDLPIDTNPPEITKTIDQCAKENAMDFSRFCDTIVPVPPEWSALREQVAYLMWLNHKRLPNGSDVILPNQLLSPESTPYQQAIISLAIKSDARKAAQVITALTAGAPPAQGYAVLRLFKRGLFKNVSRSDVFKLIDLLNTQALWWTNNRTGIVPDLHFYAYRHEAGTDATALFAHDGPVAAPDINTYIILLNEAAAHLFEHVLITADGARLRAAAKEQVGALVSNLWDGDAFTGMNIYTEERVNPGKVISYMPLALGELLPKYITAQLAATIDDGILESPLGVFALLGLNDAGHGKAAARIAKKALNKARTAGVTCPIYGAALLALAHEVL